MTSLSFPKVSIEASLISVPLPLAGCDISVSIGQCPPHPTRLGTAAVCVCRGLQIHSCIHNSLCFHICTHTYLISSTGSRVHISRVPLYSFKVPRDSDSDDLNSGCLKSPSTCRVFIMNFEPPGPASCVACASVCVECHG